MHVELVFRLRELGWGFSSCHALDLAHGRELVLGDDHAAFASEAAPSALPHTVQKALLASVLASLALAGRLACGVRKQREGGAFGQGWAGT